MALGMIRGGSLAEIRFDVYGQWPVAEIVMMNPSLRMQMVRES